METFTIETKTGHVVTVIVSNGAFGPQLSLEGENCGLDQLEPGIYRLV